MVKAVSLLVSYSVFVSQAYLLGGTTEETTERRDPFGTLKFISGLEISVSK